MKTLPRLLFLCVGILLFSLPHRARAEQNAAAEQAPKNSPPSKQIDPFLEPSLNAILAPLGENPQMPRIPVEKLRASLGAGVVTAKTPAQQQIYQTAMAVCDALTNGMDERAKATAAAISSGLLPSISTGGGIVKTAPLHGWDAGHAGDAIRKKQKDERSYADRQAKGVSNFTDSAAYKAWVAKAALLRNNAMGLYTRLVELEAADSMVEAKTAASAPGPSEAKAAAEDQDPVVGRWLLEGRSVVNLTADHSISGERHGAWRCTGETSDGHRTYALTFGAPKNWSDYVSLAYDEQTLEGHTRNSKHITYVRP